MPYKTCPKCQHKIGVRANHCTQCAHIFEKKPVEYVLEGEVKQRKIRKKKTQPEVIEDITTLNPGDLIKVGSGPYHITLSPEGEEVRHYMGEHGKFRVIKVYDKQVYAFSPKQGNVHIYMGPECEGKYINHMRPHKIIRTRKVATNEVG